MQGLFTNSLWYIEFFVFAIVLIGFFILFLYMANTNYVQYNVRYDMRQNYQSIASDKCKCKPPEPDQRPVCVDMGCIWFCRLIGSIVTIAVCYYFAYALISDTKLKFGLFVPP
ncbi:PREDICTED: uncharacterized protein LOC106118910 [Papilio xuthus]|uniref:Uncharacterized protein LOC106118910 n=1 Tax=Papilio xuthus TaxID=66420 RepID=A0AAJ6ZBT5_PAPXU|nr:PREDICTED: uncharacterized protein LOC106118910 [Papilio xuthus]